MNELLVGNLPDYILAVQILLAVANFEGKLDGRFSHTEKHDAYS